MICRCAESNGGLRERDWDGAFFYFSLSIVRGEEKGDGLLRPNLECYGPIAFMGLSEFNDRKFVAKGKWSKVGMTI